MMLKAQKLSVLIRLNQIGQRSRAFADQIETLVVQRMLQVYLLEQPSLHETLVSPVLLGDVHGIVRSLDEIHGQILW